jgi:hypothetical protein
MSCTWTFDEDPIGSVPSGFTVMLGHWAIQADPTAPSRPNALVQSGQFRTGLHFPRCLVDGVRARDLVAEVAFKPLAGENDQAGGLMFRVQDPETYYVFRANLLDDLALVHAAGGVRRALGRFQARDEGWQRLRVEAYEHAIRCYWNDRAVIEATDVAPMDGGIGLWTIADSVSAFDDLRVERQ